MNANNQKLVSDPIGSHGISRRQSRRLVPLAALFGCRTLRGLLGLVLTTGLGVVPAGQAMAQTFTVLRSFTALDAAGANSDGANPYAGLMAADNGITRYGTAANGGTVSNGTVFAINIDGSGFTNLHSFSGNDGAHPWAGLTNSGRTLYGTTYYGGASGFGTVFAVNTDGTGFTNLHSSFTTTEVIRMVDCSYPATPFMGRRLTVEVRVPAPSSPLIPTALGSGPCTISSAPPMEQCRLPD